MHKHIVSQNYPEEVYLNHVIQHGALHEEGVGAPLDASDPLVVVFHEDGRLVVLHKLPHLNGK